MSQSFKIRRNKNLAAFFSRENGTKSRYKQAPGSGFHPRGESDKNYCGFLGPSWCN